MPRPRRALGGLPHHREAYAADPLPLDHIAIVGQVGAEEMNQERLRRVAKQRHGCRHGTLLRADEGKRRPDALPRTTDRRPAHGRTFPIDGDRGDGGVPWFSAGRAGRTRVGGARIGPVLGQPSL